MFLLILVEIEVNTPVTGTVFAIRSLENLSLKEFISPKFLLLLIFNKLLISNN